MYHSTSSPRTSRSPCEELSGPRRGPSEIGSPTSTRNPMADWQMRTKRPLRGPVREEAGPTLKNYITPAGLQRLKDEHRFLLSRERPAVVLGAALGQAICVLMHRVDMYAHLCIY